MDFAIQVAGGQVRHEKSGIEAIAEEAQLAESLGFAAVFVPDHYVFERLGAFQTGEPTYELTFVMATLAQRTKTIRIGSQVACMLFRHPAMLARQLAQIDEASNGRVIAGVGAGWTRAEFEMLGIDFPNVSERLKIMDEAVEVMRGLWREAPLTFEGKHYQTRDAVMRPLPVQKPGPPIMLGGSGNGVLRRAGKWADIIHMTPAIGADGTTTIPAVAAFTDATVSEKLDLVHASARKADRDPGAIRYATTIYNYSPAESPAQTMEIAEGVGAMFNLSPEQFLRHPVVLAGTPEEMVEEIRRRERTHGLSMIAVNFSSSEQIQAFGERVIAVY